MIQARCALMVVLLAVPFVTAAPVVAQDPPAHDFWWAEGQTPDDAENRTTSAAFLSDGKVVVGGWSRNVATSCADGPRAFIIIYDQARQSTGGSESAGEVILHAGDEIWEIFTDGNDGESLRHAYDSKTWDVITGFEGTTEYIWAVGEAILGWADEGTDGAACVMWITKIEVQGAGQEDYVPVYTRIIGNDAGAEVNTTEPDCTGLGAALERVWVIGLGVHVDSSGRLAVTGSYGLDETDTGSIDFLDDGSGSSTPDDRNGDFFLLYVDDGDDGSGHHLIPLAFDVAGVSGAGDEKREDRGNAVTFDDNGNIAATGMFHSESIAFDSEVLNEESGGQDFFIVAYEVVFDGGSGEYSLDALQAQGIDSASGGGGARDDSGNGITTWTDAQGDVWHAVAGYFEGANVDFGEGPGSELTSVGIQETRDLFVVAYEWDEEPNLGDSHFVYTWGYSQGTNSEDVGGNDVAYTCDDEVVVAGSIEETNDMDEIFIASLDPAASGAGVEVWRAEHDGELIGGDDDDVALGIAAGPIGDLAVVGYITDPSGNVEFEDYRGTVIDTVFQDQDENEDGFAVRMVDSLIINDVDITTGTGTADPGKLALPDDDRMSVSSSSGGGGQQTVVEVDFIIDGDCLPDDIDRFRVMVESSASSISNGVTVTVEVRDHAGGGSWFTLISNSSVNTTDHLAFQLFDTGDVTDPVSAGNVVTIRITHNHSASFTAFHDWLRCEPLEH